jgi:catechol 2,3-dioxygenase-like lactoylglutathione lyase family enzyme
MLDHIELRSPNVERTQGFLLGLAPWIFTESRFILKGLVILAGLDFFIVGGDPSNNIVHFAFQAKDRATVHACYESADGTGGKRHKAPALAPQIHPNYYAGYVHDPEGRLIEFVCHAPE